MGSWQNGLIREPCGGLTQRIVAALGQSNGMLDLFQTLRSEEDSSRAVGPLMDTGGGHREQRDHREQADGKDGHRGQNFRERQSLLWCCELWSHAIGTYGMLTRPDTETVTVS